MWRSRPRLYHMERKEPVFPLAGKSFPQDADELQTSIRSALEEVLTFPKKGTPLEVDAPKYPKVKRLNVDLSGAKVSVKEPPPQPKPSGKREPGIDVDQLEVQGHPIQYENSKINFDLKGKQVTFEFARDKKGKPLLVLTDADEGHVDVNVAKADLQSLALAAASLAAKEQGVTIQDVNVDLKSEGKRAVSATVRVKAKNMMVSGVVNLAAKVVVDDELNATISDLSCTGEGMIGTMVAGFVQPKLKEYNGKKIALMAFSLGDLALRDLKIDVKSGLHVTAGFGK
jgi:hypothetical protein